LIIFIAKTTRLSHLPERPEKKCLNCQSELHGRFCHKCGQENLEPKESVGHLIVHFFNDVTHFDGKLFSSLKYLITRPGFLSKEYVAGRRVDYLNPIRMYLFISAAYFILSFSMHFEHGSSSSIIQDRTSTSDSSARHAADSTATEPDTTTVVAHPTRNSTISFDGRRYSIQDTSVEQYLARQKSLPDSLKDSWLERYARKKSILISRDTNKDAKGFIVRVGDHMKHSFPKVLFVFIPIFAFYLYLLYFRRRKQFYYVSHGIFSLHFFITFFVLMFFDKLMEIPAYYSGSIVFAIIGGAVLIVGMLAYLFIGMKRFYGQGGFKTFIKWSLLLFFSSITMLLLMFILLMISLSSAVDSQ
jgi:hypothetical protein